MESKEVLKSLGEKVTHSNQYDPLQLEGFSRETRRRGLTAPMNGADVWTAFEVSFLLKNGLPCYLVLRISNPAESKQIFESKSLKLYLNSFNNTVLGSKEELIETIERDLKIVAQGNVEVEVVEKFGKNPLYNNSRKLENYANSLTISEYAYNPNLLETKSAKVGRIEPVELHSDLLRSNCEITGAPDFGRIYIKYEPGEVEVTYESLIKYIVSIRTHQMFHEPTCELVYNTLFELLKPKKLLVICQYSRRGGIDINPCRYTHKDLLPIDLICLPKLIQQ
jgi:7-cyano-7-deazaguanine reductase